MKLNLHTEIEINVDNNKVLIITARKLTKKESKTFSKDVEELLSTGKAYDKLKRKLKYLNAKNEFNTTEARIDEIYELEEEIAESGQTDVGDLIEKLYKKKIQLIVDGTNKTEVIKLGEDIGYMTLDEKLTQAIEKANNEGL